MRAPDKTTLINYSFENKFKREYKSPLDSVVRYREIMPKWHKSFNQIVFLSDIMDVSDLAFSLSRKYEKVFKLSEYFVILTFIDG